VKVEHDLLSRPDSLGLRGGPFTLNDDECPTLVLQKQVAFEGVWQATVDFAPGPGEEAGTTVFWSKWSCASLGVRGTKNGREMVFRYPNPDGDDFKVRLRMVALTADDCSPSDLFWACRPKSRSLIDFIHLQLRPRHNDRDWFDSLRGPRANAAFRLDLHWYAFRTILSRHAWIWLLGHRMVQQCFLGRNVLRRRLRRPRFVDIDSMKGCTTGRS
jgi:hypothetical protein